MATDPNAVFQKFAEKVAAEFPELREILDQAKAGDLSEEDAMRCLSEVVMADPELGRRFQQVAMLALTPLREEDRAKPLDHGGALMHRERGLPKLNPLVEAALIERVQFDDDIPELRTGGMPRGVAPAVSVDTTARNPVAIGLMLGQASKEVAIKIKAADPKRQAIINDMALLDMVEGASTALAKTQERDLVFGGKSDTADVPEYRRGAVPAPVAITQPTGSALLAMTPQERKQSAWTFLSTTQGRRSGVRSIAELVDAKLRDEGFDVKVRPFNPNASEAVLAAHQWTVGIDGPGSTQAAFSIIDIAAAVIAQTLTRLMETNRGRVILEVTTVNTVDIRSVGWAGRLLAVDPALTATG